MLSYSTGLEASNVLYYCGICATLFHLKEVLIPERGMAENASGHPDQHA